MTETQISGLSLENEPDEDLLCNFLYHSARQNDLMICLASIERPESYAMTSKRLF